MQIFGSRLWAPDCHCIFLYKFGMGGNYKTLLKCHTDTHLIVSGNTEEKKKEDKKRGREHNTRALFLPDLITFHQVCFEIVF